MNAFEELVKLALVGTQRAGERAIALPAELQELASTQSTADAKLLDAAAALVHFERCGAMAGPMVCDIAPAPADERPACSANAATVLSQLCDRKEYDLLSEWFAAASKAKRRVPHWLLPAVLDRAAERIALRESIEAVIDRRGHWLASQNPRWRFAEAAGADLEASWQTGSAAERLSALKGIRTIEPARAVEWIRGTWASDPADDRVKWLGALLPALSMNDEPFLESCLDDRSSRVREAAAGLLARLPASLFIQRMIARLEPLLKWNGKVLSAELPAAFDKPMLRDGLTEKPPPHTGQKQWWRSQMLRIVPPVLWSQSFGATAEKLVAGVDKDEERSIIPAWRTATGLHADPAWATALAFSPVDLPGRWSADYLKAVPERDRSAVLAALWSANDKDSYRAAPLLEVWSPLSAQLSEEILRILSREGLLFSGAAAHLHPQVMPHLETQLQLLATQPYIGPSVNRALDTIQFRRTIHTEFAP
jgi:hypothetical protein